MQTHTDLRQKGKPQRQIATKRFSSLRVWFGGMTTKTTRETARSRSLYAWASKAFWISWIDSLLKFVNRMESLP